MTLNAKVHCKINAVETATGDLDTIVSSFNDRDPTLLADGTGANQADLVYQDSRTQAASGSTEIDLNNQTDSLGRTINFAKVKVLRIGANASNTNNVVVGAAATNQFLGAFGGADNTITLPPGGFMMWVAPVNGWASTTGVSDRLKVANSGGGSSVFYDMEVIGTSA